MDRLVRDEFLDGNERDVATRDLTFLLDEGLDLLASYSKVTDIGVRRALAGLVEAFAKAERASN